MANKYDKPLPLTKDARERELRVLAAEGPPRFNGSAIYPEDYRDDLRDHESDLAAFKLRVKALVDSL